MSQGNKKSELRYVVVGAGMAGMLAGIKLIQRGIKNFVIYEKADRVGGTWRENTYPGLTCDVPSHSYTYSFEPYADWTCLMPSGTEIQEYFEHVRVKYGLDPYLVFNEEIVSYEFLDGQWHLKTSGGHEDKADIVIAATGVLHHPRLPSIRGVDEFEGACFHSAQWDHKVQLDGQKIAVIGTGSTGVQIVSALSRRASQLTHFQRTPQWIMPVENRPFSEEEKAAFKADPELLKRVQNDPELEANIERFSAAITDPESEAMRQIDQLVLDNLERSIRDLHLREKLTPNYKPACKRLIYSPDFYEAIQRSNVDVVIEGVEQIERNGIRTADGDLREFDVIVFATGFKADMFVRPAEVKGRDGIELNDVWSDSPKAYMAIMVPGFPNFFMLNGPGGPVGNFSLIEIAEHQWGYIEKLLDLKEAGKCCEICVTQEAFEEFEARRVEAARNTIFATGCDSWYLDAQGVPATWPWTRQQFKAEMASPDASALDLR